MTEKPLAPQACYAALVTRDARFDGRFFVGVSSTRIYCRPTCHSKVPKPENCTFFRTAAEAEAAGYRPCLQCRPETAPGLSPTDAVASLALRAARAIEDDPAGIGSLEELSDRLGYTSRHVRRAFEQEYHVTPQQYLQTCRLLLAKNLLTDTTVPVAEVARACGFGSVRRFNDAFAAQYRMPPTALRKQAGKGKAGAAATAGDAGAIRVTLGYRPPYAWDRFLAFLGPRAIPGGEAVELPAREDGRVRGVGSGGKGVGGSGSSDGSREDGSGKGGSYARAVRMPTHGGGTAVGWIRVTHHPRRDALVLEASDTLAPVLPQVICRGKDLFDLRCQPEAIERHLAGMAELDVRLPIAGLRVLGCFEPFEMAVRAILGQQISVKAATTLAGRLASELGTPVETPIEGVGRVFSTAERILALGDDLGETLGRLGVTRQRQRTIPELAEGCVDGSITTAFGVDPQEQMRRLLQMHGIGDWTANYLAMRMLSWTDAFPATDLGVRKVLAPRTPKQIQEYARAWSPWRAYATLNLWNIE